MQAAEQSRSACLSKTEYLMMRQVTLKAMSVTDFFKFYSLQ